MKKKEIGTGIGALLVGLLLFGGFMVILNRIGDVAEREQTVSDAGTSIWENEQSQSIEAIREDVKQVNQKQTGLNESDQTDQAEAKPTGSNDPVQINQAETKPADSKETGQTDQGAAGQTVPDLAETPVSENLIRPEGETLSARICPPQGFTRVETDGFGTFLREYPVLPDGSRVLLYDGSEKWNQSDHVAIFDMKLTSGDLQQCADSCIRLYAEYFYGQGAYEQIAFHLVNGFLVDFDTWRKGGRVAVDGNRTEWVMNAQPSDSEETFEKYLRFVFTYASTLSLDQESKEIAAEEIRAGDFFIKGGSPGHVVMVLDVCENASGEKAFLLGQGYMPAQQFHVLKNPAHEDDPWYDLSELSYPFSTPEYVFSDGSLKRPGYIE